MSCMAFQRTTDHDEIRAWIEEHRGTPVVIAGEDGEVLDFAFGDLTGFDTLTWEEFFDRFDAEGLAFRYSSGEVIPGEEQLSYNFVPEDAPSDTHEDPTELVEENELAEENLDPENADEF
jgi:hypothetical protein